MSLTTSDRTTRSIAPSFSDGDRASGQYTGQATCEGLPERININYQSECDSYSQLGKQHAIEGWLLTHHRAYARLIVMPTWKLLYQDAYRQQMRIEAAGRVAA